MAGDRQKYSFTPQSSAIIFPPWILKLTRRNFEGRKSSWGLCAFRRRLTRICKSWVSHDFFKIKSNAPLVIKSETIQRSCANRLQMSLSPKESFKIGAPLSTPPPPTQLESDSIHYASKALIWSFPTSCGTPTDEPGVYHRTPMPWPELGLDLLGSLKPGEQHVWERSPAPPALHHHSTVKRPVKAQEPWWGVNSASSWTSPTQRGGGHRRLLIVTGWPGGASSETGRGQWIIHITWGPAPHCLDQQDPQDLFRKQEGGRILHCIDWQLIGRFQKLALSIPHHECACPPIGNPPPTSLS